MEALIKKAVSDALQAQGSKADSDKAPKEKTVTSATQLMRDIAASAQIPPSPSDANATVISDVLTFYTNNRIDSLSSYTKDGFVFDWMGIARLYLSPLNLGLDKLKAAFGAERSLVVDWIRVKLLNVTFSASETTHESQTLDSSSSQTPPTTVEGSTDPSPRFLSVDGTTFTMAYRPASYLLGIPDTGTTDQGASAGKITTKLVGDAFGAAMLTASQKMYGVGFTTPKLKGVDTPYRGDYASEVSGARTERLGTACEVVIARPEAQPLVLSGTTAFSGIGTAENTYSYGGTPSAPYTFGRAWAFQEKQGAETSTSVSDALTPIYGMIQIDLPEDLIQEVYMDKRVTVDTKLVPTMEDGGYDLYVSKTTRTRAQVLNANYKVLVEYGFRT